MRASFKLLIVLFYTALILSSCVKKTQEADSETDSTAENNTATSIANDMGNIADEAGKTNAISSFKMEQQNAILSSCATLKFDTLNHSNPDSITVNFANNCVCQDQRTRSGSLLITFSGKYKDSLMEITITPINYFVDAHGVSGTKKIKNSGHNAQGHLVYQLTENISITKPNNGGTIVFNSNREREWISGENTPNYWADDVYSLTGSASGTNANGRSFQSIISKPLIRKMSFGCRRNFVSGEMKHTPQNKPTRIIDFGDGTCDNLATVTINGKVYQVTLP